MATYKKKGNKPSSKEEQIKHVEEESTTAEVFNTLDEGANRTEEWVAANQKYIYIVVGLAAIIILGYLGWQRFIQEPKEIEAANEMSQAQDYFNSALASTGAQSDSLYTMSLNGGEGKFGFLDIIDNYGSTPSGNLAKYYAGFAYLNTNKYQEAIDQLEDYNGDDEITAPLAVAGIGDAFMQLDQPEEALNYYDKAASMRSNSFTTPKALMKAAITAIQLGKGEKAASYLNRIKDEFSTSPEAATVPVYLGQAQAMKQ
ncbi:tetratricopeptide repeat protein [Gillisia sp. M10.2A]|uniref:Tetratricopeptide repeat protein n=1 Tax=Gillisia lutea TaxID=2909668 RepID=A0ABS9EEZ9_9FLAO|nr:tetratricopeptide repeat protein [Gillisia lutea]MCF4101368.1 tetratricopeptide repeat protein [Gillisia lutea]